MNTIIVTATYCHDCPFVGCMLTPLLVALILSHLHSLCIVIIAYLLPVHRHIAHLLLLYCHNWLFVAHKLMIAHLMFTYCCNFLLVVHKFVLIVGLHFRYCQELPFYCQSCLLREPYNYKNVIPCRLIPIKP